MSADRKDNKHKDNNTHAQQMCGRILYIYIYIYIYILRVYARVHHAIPESLKKGGSQGGAPHPAEVSAQAAPAGERRRGVQNGSGGEDLAKS